MADIDLTPTEEMASNAARGLELREKHGRGGTAVGVARARDIKHRKNLSPDTVRRMHSFFSRHAGNEAGGEDDAGYISFLLWGGAAGRSWAKRKSAQLDKDENAMSDTRKEIMERLGMAAHPGAKAKFGNVDRLDSLMAAVYRALKNNDKEAAKRLMADAAKEIDSNTPPYMLAEYKDLKRSFSRPGAKAKYQKEYILWALPKGETDRLEERPIAEGIQTPKQMDEAKRKAAAAGWHGFRVQILDMSKPFRWMSRPGAKAKFGITNAASAFLKKMLREYASMKGTRWYDEAKYISDNPTEHTDADVIAAVGNLKVAKSVSSRPGAKARFADGTESFLTIKGVRYRIVGTRKDAKGNLVYDLHGTSKTAHPVTYTLVKFLDDQRWVLWGAQGQEVARGKMEASRPGAKAEMAANDVPLNKPFTVRGKQVIVRTAHPDGYEIFPTSGSYSLGRVNTLNREAVIQAMEAQNRKAASNLLSLLHSRPGAKVTNAVREGSKISAEDEACLKVMSAADEKVSGKIRTLIAEGKPQKQAVAIALDLKRRGEL